VVPGWHQKHPDHGPGDVQPRQLVDDPGGLRPQRLARPAALPGAHRGTSPGEFIELRLHLAVASLDVRVQLLEELTIVGRDRRRSESAQARSTAAHSFVREVCSICRTRSAVTPRWPATSRSVCS